MHWYVVSMMIILFCVLFDTDLHFVHVLTCLWHHWAKMGTFRVPYWSTLAHISLERCTKRHASPSVLKIKVIEPCKMVSKLPSFAFETLITFCLGIVGPIWEPSGYFIWVHRLIPDTHKGMEVHRY